MSTETPNELVEKAKSKPPSFQDDEKNRLILVNYQTDFATPGRNVSYVKGSQEVVEDTVSLIEANLDVLTQVVPALCNHFINQIFFSTIWGDVEGLHPKTGTKITAEDFAKEKWKLQDAANWIGMDNDATVVKMVEKYLEIFGEIEILPLHCLNGTTGQTLVCEINEVRFKHSFVRRYAPETEMYNHHPLMCSPSVFGVEELDTLNQRFLKESGESRRVFFAGFNNVVKSAQALAKWVEKHAISDEDWNSHFPGKEKPKFEIYVIEDLCTEELPADYGYYDILGTDASQVASLMTV